MPVSSAMENVSSEILFKILSFLTLQEKGRILSVSKKWDQVGRKLIQAQETIACNVDASFLRHHCRKHRIRAQDLIPFSVYLKLMITGKFDVIMPNLRVIVVGFGIPQLMKFIHSYR